MKYRPTIRTVALGIITIGITAAMSLSGCGNQSRSSNDQSAIEETGSPQQTDQEQKVLDQRRTKSDEFLTFEANLTESEETSEQPTGAKGTATFSLHSDSIHIKGKFSGLNSAYKKSAIHKVLESEKVTSLTPTIGNTKKSGTWEGSYHLTEDEISALKSDSLYISVYSEAYESSAIKGQIRAVDSTNTAADSTEQ